MPFIAGGLMARVLKNNRHQEGCETEALLVLLIERRGRGSAGSESHSGDHRHHGRRRVRQRQALTPARACDAERKRAIF